MSNGNRIKAEFLGMPYGTAMGRLRKQILFNLLQYTGGNICFKCEEPITECDELSIEHKEPWLNRENGQELFWSMENIAFSHIRCNKPHMYNQPNPKKVGPEGTSWCFSCQDFIDISKFGKDSSRWDGVKKLCKMHKAEENKRRYTHR